MTTVRTTDPSMIIDRRPDRRAPDEMRVRPKYGRQDSISTVHTPPLNMDVILARQAQRKATPNYQTALDTMQKPPADFGQTSRAYSRARGDVVPGRYIPGNIDLHHRPTVHNQDGSISTVRSITVTSDDGKAYLIPTVVGDKVVSNDDAIKHWQQTGEHLGVFNDETDADNYAQQLHEEQAKEYLPDDTSKMAALNMMARGRR